MNDLNNKDKSPELDGYKNALRDAYPQPKTDIRAAVIAQITAENTKVLSKKPKSKLGSLVKWGSLAACIVLVGAVCIRVLPIMNSLSESDNVFTGKDAAISAEGDMLDEDKASVYNDEKNEIETLEFAISDQLNEVDKNQEASTEADDPSVGSSPEAEETLDGAKCDVSETIESDDGGDLAGASEDYSNAEADEPDETVYEFPSAAYPDSIVTETDGAITDCDHAETFMNSYHEIPALLINLIGEGAYSEWLSTTDGECGANIASFIEYFGLPCEIFEVIVGATDLYYLCDYPIEILYCGDAARIEKYYAAGGDMQASVSRYFEYEFKMAIASSEHVDGYSVWMRERGYDSAVSWSIAELSRDMGISAAELEAIYANVKREFASIYDGVTLPGYDFKMIEEYGEQIKTAVESGMLGYEVDGIYRK